MWNFIRSGCEGNCELFGVNIFQYEWRKTNKDIKVFDPLYHQKHIINIYKVNIDGNIFEFAAGEFSNGVYAFYVQEKKRCWK